MSLAYYERPYIRPDFYKDFDKIVFQAAEPLREEEQTKRQLFLQAKMLSLVLNFAAKNFIRIDARTIALVQSILDGMERHLDGETRPVELDVDELRDLRKLYLDMCQYVCEINIRQADAAKRA